MTQEENSTGSMEVLRITLRGYQRETLLRIATATGLHVDDVAKETLVTMLASHLAEPPVVNAALDRLTETERLVFNAIVALGGYATTALLCAHLVAAGIVTTPPSSPGLSPHDSANEAPRRLSLPRHGLRTVEARWLPMGHGEQGMASFDVVLSRLTQLGLVFSETLPGMPPHRGLFPDERVFISPPALKQAG